MYPPKMKRKKIMKKFQRDTPKICLQTAAVNKEVLDDGGDLRIFSRGGSVERAIAAKVSMIKLIQRSWTAFIGDSAKKINPTTMMSSAETLTVIWNCRNLVTL